MKPTTFKKSWGEKVKKIEFFLAAILDFWLTSWIDNGYLIILYSIYGKNHLYHFGTFITKWTINTPIGIFLPFFHDADRKNQFWPNTVHAYKNYPWSFFVLCVVFKWQYFWSYSRKLIFDHLYTSFKGPSHTQNWSIDQIFFLRV